MNQSNIKQKSIREKHAKGELIKNILKNLSGIMSFLDDIIKDTNSLETKLNEPLAEMNYLSKWQPELYAIPFLPKETADIVNDELVKTAKMYHRNSYNNICASDADQVSGIDVKWENYQLSPIYEAFRNVEINLDYKIN